MCRNCFFTSRPPPENHVPEVRYLRDELYVPTLGELNALVSGAISHIAEVTSASRIRNVQLHASIVASIWFANRLAEGRGIGDVSLVGPRTSH